MKEAEYQKRRKAIEALPNGTMFYWQSYGYVGNCLSLWAIGGRGYTTVLTLAQLYDKESTLRQLACKRDTDVFWESEELIAKSRLMVDHQYIDKAKRF